MVGTGGTGMSHKRDNKIPQDMVELLLAQEGLCFYCGDPLPLTSHVYHLAITRDHFYPKKEGGGRGSNIVLCHRMCNEDKAHSLPNGRMIKLFYDLQEIVQAKKESIEMLYAKYKYLGRKGMLKYNE